MLVPTIYEFTVLLVSSLGGLRVDSGAQDKLLFYNSEEARIYSKLSD